MSATVLATTKDIARDEWLELRKNGIGGSDAATVLGINPWKSQVELWLEKTGQIEAKEPGEAAYWGIKLEDMIAYEFAERTGLAVRRRNAILQHVEYSFMLANVDRLIVGRDEGLECKTTNEYMKKKWIDDEIPANYIIQCMHYMAVTGYSAWWIAVLIGGNKFVYKKIERDEELISYIIEKEKVFWQMVQENIMPPADGSEACTEVLSRIYPESNGQVIELPNEYEVKLARRDQVVLDIKELKTEKEELENLLKQELGENEIGICGERKISWKSAVRSSIDSKLLKEELPEIYSKYCKQTSYRILRIS